MITIKSYTSLDQSRKLAEFLPIKSADMGWNVFVDNTTRILPIDDWDLSKNSGGNLKFYPAWSLAALLELIPNYQLQTQDDGIGILFGHKKGFEEVTAECPLDACVAMIEKLHKQKLL